MQQQFFKGIRPDTILVEAHVYQSPHISVSKFFLTSSNSIREIGTGGYWYANTRGEFMCGNCYARIVKSFDSNEELDRKDDPATYIKYSPENPKVKIKHLVDVPHAFFTDHEDLLPSEIFMADRAGNELQTVGLYTVADSPPSLNHFFKRAVQAFKAYTTYLLSIEDGNKWQH